MSTGCLRQCLRRNTDRGWGERALWAPRVGQELLTRLTCVSAQGQAHRTPHHGTSFRSLFFGIHLKIHPPAGRGGILIVCSLGIVCFDPHNCQLFSHVRLFVTPWTVAHQASPSVEFSKQEYWSGLPCPSPENLPNPGLELRSLVLQADSLPSEPPGKLKNTGVSSLSLLQWIFLTQESNRGLPVLQTDSLPSEL